MIFYPLPMRRAKENRRDKQKEHNVFDDFLTSDN
jgi:hypothetical protein